MVAFVYCITLRIIEESDEDILNEHEDGKKLVNAKNVKCVAKKKVDKLMFKKKS